MSPSLSTFMMHWLAAGAALLVVSGASMQTYDALREYKIELGVLTVSAVVASLERRMATGSLINPVFSVLTFPYQIWRWWKEFKEGLADAAREDGHSLEKLNRALYLTIEWGLILYGGVFATVVTVIQLGQDYRLWN